MLEGPIRDGSEMNPDFTKQGAKVHYGSEQDDDQELLPAAVLSV